MTSRVIKLVTVLAGLAAGSVIAAARELPIVASTPIAARDETKSTRIAGVPLKLILKIVITLSVIAAIGGMLVATSGLIQIKASSGHWPATHWLLDFAKQRSVATNSRALTVPPLNDAALVLKGAGHYETGCAPCHGNPGRSVPRIAWRMTPNPPSLPEKVLQYDDAELFYIVKHGIKFTGMPAWPTPQRDDEVWAMVAFMRQLPGMNGATYQQLSHGDGAPNADVVPLAGLVVSENVRRAISESCARCHGYDGNGRGTSAFPKLAGQRVEYLYASMQAYARHQRHSGVMEPVAAGLDDEATRAVADYYARLPRAAPATQDTAAIERGQQIAQHGIPAQRVAACSACHGPGATERRSIYPLLDGQYADYLTLQLQLFKSGERGGTSFTHVMRQAAGGLTEAQMRDVAAYYASLVASRLPITNVEEKAAR